jgi:hypothetical protein
MADRRFIRTTRLLIQSPARRSRQLPENLEADRQH